MATIDSTQSLYIENKQRNRSISMQPAPVWHWIALGVILLISAFLNFYRLDQSGSVNTYYEAGVKSMLMSWHNFFFVSFDPGGFVTIDKPPLGFWIQAASAKLFGFSRFSLLLPEALAGVLSVALLYHLVGRSYGRIAGLLAALALALSPLSISTSRDTTIDMLLVLTVLLATWAFSLAVERGHIGWLLAAAGLVGLGFNIKMLDAYLVVPAFGLVYLLDAPLSWRKRILHLLLALAVLIAVSFAWIMAVDLTPASQRPYVGSSGTNSELNLALGYNGVERLTGRQAGGAGGGQTRTTRASTTGRQTRATQDGGTGNQTHTRQTGGQGAGIFAGAGGIGDANGAPGPLRLLNQQLGPQVGWLLPLAVLGLLVAAWQAWRQGLVRLPLQPRQQALALWGTWLFTMGIFFSMAGFFHSYYMVMFVPAIFALFGIGVVVLCQEYRGRGWQGWLLPFALVGTAAVQALLIAPYASQRSWLTPLVIGLSLLSALLQYPQTDRKKRHVNSAPQPASQADRLSLGKAKVSSGFASGIARFLMLKSNNDGPRPEGNLVPERSAWLKNRVFPNVAMLIGVLALLIAPAVWGGQPVLQARATQAGTFGQGYTATRGTREGTTTVRGTRQNTSTTQLERYLLAHQGNARFILATLNATTAAPFILDTGKAVMALGGFSGADNILTQAQLASLVQQGVVRFFLLSGARGGFGGGNGSLTQWVSQHCSVVPASQWQAGGSGTNNTTGNGFTRGNAQQLYDCANAS